MKKLISLLISMIVLFQLSVQVFAAYPEEHARAYEAAGCAVTYTVQKRRNPEITFALITQSRTW